MSASKLATALKSIPWDENVTTFLSDPSAGELCAACSLRLAIWAKQFEIADRENPSLAFVRQMQVSGHHVAATAALAIYASAAAAMRSVFDSALYYSYFRSHLTELSTLARDRDYYVNKNDILDFHKTHTVGFVERQASCKVLSDIADWYKDISSLIHGQIPGAWNDHKSMSDIKHRAETLNLVMQKWTKTVDIVHMFFLCTVAQDLWHDFAPESKRKLLFGISGATKEALKLDL